MKFGSFQVLHIIVNHLFKMTEKQKKKKTKQNTNQQLSASYFYYSFIIIGQ